MLFQDHPVLNPPDALVISVSDITPKIGIPEALKEFVKPTTVAPP